MRGARLELLGPLIDRFYEAAVCPPLWRPVLHDLSMAVDAEGATLVPYNLPDLLPVASEGLDEAVAKFVEGGWQKKNSRGERGIRLKTDRVMTESEMFSEDELDRLPINAEFFNPLGFRWFIGAKASSFGDGAILLSIDRLKKRGRFAKREVQGVGAALPHLRRALQLTFQFS